MSYRPKVKTDTSGNTQDFGLDADTLDGKHASDLQDKLVSGTNIKTINNNSILGSGDLSITADDLKARYHLGAFDTVSGNVITRQTGYIKINDFTISKISQNRFQMIPTLSDSVSYQDSEVPYMVVNKTFTVVKANDVYNNSSNNIITINNTKFLLVFVSADYYTNHSADDFMADYGDVYIQYKLATSYTEKVIENQPLNTLDQKGSNWLRDEYNKGLNLFDKSTVVRGKYISYASGHEGTNDSYCYGYIDIKPNTTYCCSSASADIHTAYFNGTTYISGVLNQTIFTAPSNATRMSISLPIADLDTFMLNEGLTVLPYQEYNGAIVHKKDLSSYVADSDRGKKVFQVNRTVDTNANTTKGYWAAMVNATSPIPNDWYHVISMDWSDGDGYYSWYSQIALPTVNGGVPYYRKNDNSNTTIGNSTWHAFITDENISSYLHEITYNSSNMITYFKTNANNGYANIIIENTRNSHPYKLFVVGRNGSNGNIYIGNQNSDSVWNDSLFEINPTTGKASMNGIPLATVNDIPTVPTNVSAFTNDAGYLTSHQSLDSCAKIRQGNDMIFRTNEISFVPSGYSGEVYINFRTAGDSTNGNITDYYFCNGGGTILKKLSELAQLTLLWSGSTTTSITGLDTSYTFYLLVCYWGTFVIRKEKTTYITAASYTVTGEVDLQCLKVSLASNGTLSWSGNRMDISNTSVGMYDGNMYGMYEVYGLK